MSDPVSNYVAGLPPVLAIRLACEVAQCGPATLYVLMGEQKVRAVKMGGKTLIDTASLLAYLANLPKAKITTKRPKRKQREEAAA